MAGYPRYVWITYSWYQSKWWTSKVNSDPVECDEEELTQLLKQSLSVGSIPVPSDPNAITDVRLVRQ